jgi:hypothetical protein
VRWDRNSRSPISLLVSPSAASSAISSCWGVSDAGPKGSARPVVRPVARSSWPARCVQGERVALRVGDQPLAHARRQRREPLLEQGRRGRPVERLELATGQSSAIEEAPGLRPQGRQEPDAGAGEATHGRGENQRTRPVQPLQIIDHNQQGPGGRGVAKKGESRVRDHQPVRRRSGVQPESDAERLAMQRRQRGQTVQERVQDNVEPREAELRLELRADSPNDPRSSRLRVECGDIEQRRLADTGVAGHQQRPAPDRRVVREPADELDVLVPADEPHGKITTHRPSVECAEIRVLQEGWLRRTGRCTR